MFIVFYILSGNIKEENLFKLQTVIFIGRLSFQKSPWHLINSFNLLLKKNKDVNLIFIGDGDQKVYQYINTQIKKYNIEKHVHFLGRKSNPYKYLRRSDVLALSSYYEGTPNVIVEAIALNIPVVSSNCTKGIQELMSMEEHKKSSKNIIVESGIITPNFYKGELDFPKDNKYTKEEEMMALALEDILKIKASKDFNKSNTKLLNKFNLEFVSNQYLK